MYRLLKDNPPPLSLKLASLVVLGTPKTQIMRTLANLGTLPVFEND